MELSKTALWGSPGLAFHDFISKPKTEWHLPWQDAPQATEMARQLYALESMQPTPTSNFTEPFSLPWFLEIEKHRHSRHGQWIPKILEFSKHQGETLLGLGDGLGTDWVQYAQHGASVVVCTSSEPQLSLVRRNFEVRGLEGKFVQAHPSRLPLESSSIDVACISSLTLGIDSPPEMVEEVYRVLKPGGKVLAVTSAKYNIEYWERICFFWKRWFEPNSAPIHEEKGMTGKDLRQLFQRFVDHKVYKRHLRRSEVPHLWRVIPLTLFARLVGKVLAVKAFKPLRASR